MSAAMSSSAWYAQLKDREPMSVVVVSGSDSILMQGHNIDNSGNLGRWLVGWLDAWYHDQAAWP